MEPLCIGQIMMFAGNFAPKGWSFCNGQFLSISSNQALFAIIGTIYGGDGRSNFALPDLRGRVPIGFGRGKGLTDVIQGTIGGTEVVTLQGSQIPASSYEVTKTVDLSNAYSTISIPAFADEGEEKEPNSDAVLALGINSDGSQIKMYSTDTPDTSLKSFKAPLEGSIIIDERGTTTGNGYPHDNMQPYLGVNYIIATEGIFPSRS